MNSKQKKSDTQILEVQKKRLMVLKKQLMDLYFLTVEEVQDVLTEMQFMPQSAYDEVLELIKAARLKQDDFLKIQSKKNPEYLHDFEHKVQSEYKKAIQEISARESNYADTILSKLYKNI